MDVRDLFEKMNEVMDKKVTLSGWVRNHRKQKEFGFILMELVLNMYNLFIPIN